MGWLLHVLSLEIRKFFAYRVAFWVKFIIGTVTELTIAYYLWGAIFESTGQATIGGYSFHGLLYYTVFAALGSKVVQSLDRGGFISDDIYQGGLSRYLLYPVPYLAYRYMTFLSQQLVAIAQLLLGFFVATRIWDLPPDLAITPASVALGVATALLCGTLMFLLNSALEMVAFWQDTVWNLLAMLRFIGNLLGGLLVPLSMFPAWGRAAVAFTPFPIAFSFPIRCFLGRVGPAEWIRSIGLLGVWVAVMGAVVALIWRRGTRIYSGVGI